MLESDALLPDAAVSPKKIVLNMEGLSELKILSPDKNTYARRAVIP